MKVEIEFYHDTGMWTIYAENGCVVGEFITRNEAIDEAKTKGWRII